MAGGCGWASPDALISGITSSSPALSVSAKTGEAAFSVYQAGKYDIYARFVGEQA